MVESAKTEKRTLLRLEKKLDLLLKKSGVDFAPYADTPRNIIEAIQAGENLKAIKLCREWNGLGLKDAKEYVEDVEDALPRLK